MKKIITLGVTALIAGMISLTSCLDGGENTTTGAGFGYASFDMNAGIVVKDDFGSVIAASAFNSQLTGGEYVYYLGSVDWEAQTTTDYTVATISQIEKYPEIPTFVSIVDTTTVVADEMAVEGVTVYMYDANYVFTANKHMFMSATHKNVPSDIKTDYYFSYDYNAEPTILGDTRVYDFYLRAVKVSDGTKVSTDTSILCAYDLIDFLNEKRSVEKSLGNTSVNIRIHYVKEINDNVLNWETTKTYSFVIPTEASNY